MEEEIPLMRHLIIKGRISDELLVNLIEFVDRIEVPFREKGSLSYALVQPKISWSFPLHFNVPSLCWDDQMTYYVVIEVQSSIKLDTSGALSKIFASFPSAAVSKTESFLIFGFDGPVQAYHSVDLNLLNQSPYPTLLLPSYFVLHDKPTPNHTKRIIEAEWAVSLPNEPNPSTDQIYKLSYFQQFRNLVRYALGQFLLTGTERSLLAMYRNKKVLRDELGTKCKLLMFCNRECNGFVPVTYDSRLQGSKYRCDTCGGTCVYVK